MEIKKFHPLRQPLTPEQQNQKLKDVSKLYEKQFLREMTKQMRATVTEGGFMNASNAEKIFREQLDEQYVENWGDQGGIGLANVIHEQLLDRLGPALGIRPRPHRPMGPIKIDERNSSAQNPLKFQNISPQKTQVQIDLKATPLESQEVTSPWSGTLLGSKQLNPDEYLMEILHDDGLKSQMVFRGQPAPELKPAAMGGNDGAESAPGSQISAGQRIGLLSPEAKSLFWTVSL